MDAMKKNKIVTIEFFGLPGCGKSTVSKKIISELNSRGIRAGDYYDEFHNKKKSKVGEVLNAILLLIKNFKLFFSLLNLSNWEVAKLKSILYFIKLLSFKKTKAYSRISKNYDVLVFDQYLIQALGSISITGNDNKVRGKNIHNITPFIMKGNNVFVYIKIDRDIALKRVRLRSNGRTRFDNWNDELAKNKLIALDKYLEKIAYSLFESNNKVMTFNNSCNDIIKIESMVNDIIYNIEIKHY